MGTPVLCFHCTTRADGESIVAEGLRPESYLFSDYELTREFAEGWLEGEDWVVLAVQTGGVELVPDEGFGVFGDEILSWIAPDAIEAGRIRADVFAAIAGR